MGSVEIDPFKKVAAAAKRAGLAVSERGQAIADKALATALEAAYSVIEAKFASGTLSLADTYQQLFSAFLREATTPRRQMFETAAIKVANAIDLDREQTDKLPYHNRAHFAKVGLNAVALAVMHNGSGNAVKLNQTDLAELLFNAVAHDFDHDGTGNTVDGQHMPFRLESIAVGSTMSVLADMAPAQKLQLSQSLDAVYGTDVSGGVQPSGLVRQAHDHWFGLQSTPLPKNLTGPLKTIIHNPKKALKASFLQDADVLHSVLTPKQSRYESALVAEELGKVATPQAGLYFLNSLIHGRMTTQVADRLGKKTIETLRADYQQEIDFPLKVRPMIVQRPVAQRPYL